VIPCYRSSGTLPALLAELDDALGGLTSSGLVSEAEVLLVVDGSPDDTEQVARDEASSRPHVSVLALRRNFGQHNALVAGIRAARAALPGVPHVAVFDTAFHQTMPPAAAIYAIDRAVAAEHGVRRYGFHGTSHQFVAVRAAALLGRPLAELKLIVLHLGNGASAAAIDGGAASLMALDAEAFDA